MSMAIKNFTPYNRFYSSSIRGRGYTFFIVTSFSFQQSIYNCDLLFLCINRIEYPTYDFKSRIYPFLVLSFRYFLRISSSFTNSEYRGLNVSVFPSIRGISWSYGLYSKSALIPYFSQKYLLKSLYSLGYFTFSVYTIYRLEAQT